jgi:NADPH-dependent 2,4-dienoyl-CoA reductase/sulfur reductase-like enzyme
MSMQRRDFLKFAGAGLATAITSAPLHARAGNARPHVVIVGAGFGGSTCAKYLRMWDPKIQVTLIEPNAQYISCPMSNWVLGGLRTMDDTVQSYKNLSSYGIKLVQDKVVGVDTDKRVVATQGGAKIAYDRLILAPGVEFITEQIEGYAAGEAAGIVTHAWRQGPSIAETQTVRLKKQLEAMPDGGVFVIASPPPPGRCVSGPYERACMVAHYFKQHKPKSKIIMLDGHIDVVSKGPMFKKAWKQFYAGMIDHRPYNLVTKVDHKTMVVTSEFEDVKADVINIVPKQRAPEICRLAGVRTDSAGVWCPVNGVTYESKSTPFVHVLGDSVASNMPKSAHVSNNQAKICAAALVEMYNDREPNPYPIIGSTSYSATSDHTSGPIAVVMRYDPDKEAYIRQPGGGASEDSDELNFEYNKTWFEHIWADSFA